MNHFYNNAIIEKKRRSLEDLTITYRLLENNFQEEAVYSLLITLSEKDAETDLYIPDVSLCKSTALHILNVMCENLVLPSETAFLFSDGAFDKIFSDKFS